GSSDGSINQPSPNAPGGAASAGQAVAGGTSLPHPRGNGAFARRIARYVTERHVVTLEHAVRTMTSLPAHVFGLVDRGEIRPGAFADIVIFDPARVKDRATYADPFPLADGIDWVIVNGVVERKEGEFTGAKGGKVLRKDTGSRFPNPEKRIPMSPQTANCSCQMWPEPGDRRKTPGVLF